MTNTSVVPTKEGTMSDDNKTIQDEAILMSQRFHDIALEVAKIVYAKRPVEEDSSLITKTTFDFLKDYLKVILILNDLWRMVQEVSLSEKCDNRENSDNQSVKQEANDEHPKTRQH